MPFAISRKLICTGLVLAASLALTVSADVANAQHFGKRRYVPGQKFGRFLGLYYGDGYHCQNPGPNTDYYHPYSVTNSVLIGQNQRYDLNSSGSAGFDAVSVPRRIYTGNGSGNQQEAKSVLQRIPGQTVRPFFEPVPQQTDAEQELDPETFEELLDDLSESKSEANGAGAKRSGSGNKPGAASGSGTRQPAAGQPRKRQPQGSQGSGSSNRGSSSKPAPARPTELELEFEPADDDQVFSW